MKVLLLGSNIASQIQIAVEALTERGIDARGIVSSPKEIQSNDGLELIYPPGGHHRRYSVPWVRRHGSAIPTVLRAIRWADVVHYHYGGNWALPREIDRRWVRALDRVRLITFHGEIRIAEIEAADNPYFRQYLDERSQRDTHTTGKSMAASRAIQQMYANDGYACVLGSETMIPHVQHDIMADPRLIRNMIDPRSIEPAYPNPDTTRPVVAHMPSSREIKGTKAVLDAVDVLKRRGLDFEFLLIENTPREEALKLLRSSDVFLDQFVISGYGVAAIEAMAYGKPVVCYIAPSVAEHYPAELPIVIAGQDDLAASLESLLKDGQLRAQLGHEGRLFASTFHDPRSNTGQLVELYDELLEARRGTR